MDWNFELNGYCTKNSKHFSLKNLRNVLLIRQICWSAAKKHLNDKTTIESISPLGNKSWNSLPTSLANTSIYIVQEYACHFICTKTNIICVRFCHYPFDIWQHHFSCVSFSFAIFFHIRIHLFSIKKVCYNFKKITHFNRILWNTWSASVFLAQNANKTSLYKNLESFNLTSMDFFHYENNPYCFRIKQLAKYVSEYPFFVKQKFKFIVNISKTVRNLWYVT